jgi:hypothetical protein
MIKEQNYRDSEDDGEGFSVGQNLACSRTSRARELEAKCVDCAPNLYDNHVNCDSLSRHGR